MQATYATRDYSDPLLEIDQVCAAHATQHDSAMPLRQSEVVSWTECVEVVGDHYAKRVNIVAWDGTRDTILLPLFNRLRFDKDRPLIPSLYLAPAVALSHDLSKSHRWTVVDLGGVEPAGDQPLVRELGLSFGPRNPLWKWSRDGTTYLVDSACLLETLIARDEPIFRVLLSPFKELALQVRVMGEEVVVRSLDSSAFRPRGRAVRAGADTGCDSFEDLVCMAYWLAEPSRRADLIACGNSIRWNTELFVPHIQGCVMAGLSGYERGATFLVTGIDRLDSTPLWPCPWKTITALDQRAQRGRVLSIPASEVRDEGTRRQTRPSIRRLTALETLAQIEEFKRGHAPNHPVDAQELCNHGTLAT